MTTQTECPLALSDVAAARLRLGHSVLKTPCIESPSLSELTGAQVFCKQEFLQRTGSFKERGARNALLQLTPEQAKRGVIAASAGNHALGLAWHGQLLHIPVTVVMPRFAPLVKVTRCRQFGARVILHGDTFDEARSHADTIAAAEQLAYVPPFDDVRVIAGQGTLALELLEQVPDLDAVVVPVGGGGLLAGLVTVFGALRPEVQVIGVEPANAASFAAGVVANTPVRITTHFTLADGLAVAKTGDHTLAITQAAATPPRLVTVNEESIAVAILKLAELEKCVVEGASAVGLAALLSGKLVDLKGKKVVLLLTGGNIDPLAHSHVIERGLAADGRIYRFTALLTDRPGALAHLSAVLADSGANVTEITHNRTFGNPNHSRVQCSVTVETRDRDHILKLEQNLANADIEIQTP